MAMIRESVNCADLFTNIINNLYHFNRKYGEI